MPTTVADCRLFIASAHSRAASITATFISHFNHYPLPFFLEILLKRKSALDSVDGTMGDEAAEGASLVPDPEGSDDDDEAAVARASEGFERHKHEGVVELVDGADGRQYLINNLSREVTVMPGTGWTLVFEGGYGVLASETQPHIFVDQQAAFKKHVWRRPSDGNLFVETTDGADTVMENLTQSMRRYRSGSMQWQYGAGHTAEVQLFFLRVRRGGCNLFWSLKDLYHQCNLSSYKGEPSKWSYNGIPSWSEFLAGLSFRDCFIKSPQGMDAQLALNSVTHFLPTPSASTLAFVAIIFRFLTPSAQSGGLRQQHVASHVADWVRGFCSCLASSVLPGDPWLLPICLTYSWSHNNSLGPARFEAAFSLVVGRDGTVDVSPLILAAQTLPARSHLPAKRWGKLLQDLGDVCSLYDLLHRVSSATTESRARSLSAQLVCGVAKRVELFAYKQLTDPAVPPCALACAVDAVENSLKTSRDVDVVLYQHLMSGRSAICNTPCISMGSDKAWVKGMNLANTVMVLPNNVAIVCAPQVRRANIGSQPCAHALCR